MIFINFSNHSSKFWGNPQKEAAMSYGEVLDMPFPAVPALSDEDDIEDLAEHFFKIIADNHPEAVLCQGEFSLCFRIVSLLLKADIKTLCACSERKTIEKVDSMGVTTKEAVFEFLKFREYR